MANTSTQSSFVIYDEEFNSSLVERLQTNIDVWNTSSKGGLVLTTKALMGHYSKVSMYKALAQDVIKELDPTKDGVTSWDTFESFENVSVKVKRTVNIKKTVDAFRVMLNDPAASFSQITGALTADLITKDAIETGLSALAGAIENEPTFVLGDGTKPLTFKDINAAQFVYGDQFSKVACILVHSNTARGLVDLNIDEKLSNVAGVTIQSGQWSTLGIPVVITDLDALKDGAGFKAMFLTEGGLMVEASESVDAFTQIDLEASPALLKFKREWAFNVAVKGFSYDTAKGAYPTKAVLANKTSWKKTVQDNKELPAVIFKAKTSA